MMRKNINIIIKLILLCFFAGLGNLAHAQANYSNYYFPESPKAPTSEAFLKYGDLQNSEYTGTNSPSINLFNLKSGAIEVPVNLNYISGNGIRVTDEASMAGLGWILSFPTIVQNVYGYDDFSNNERFRLDFAKSTLPYASSFPLTNGPTNFNQSPLFDTYGYFMATNNNVPRNGNFTSLFTNFAAVDMQPDVFTLNLFGEKIEFIISNFESYSPTVPQSILFNSLNKKGYLIKKTAAGFEIKNSRGVTYQFNNIEKIESASTGAYQVSGINYLITEIIDINNNKISFNYNSIDSIQNLPSYSSFLNYTTDYYQNFCQLASSNNLESFITNDPSPVPNPNMFDGLNKFRNNILINTQKQNYLLPSSINSDNGKLLFIYSDRIDVGTKKLDKITLLTFNNVIADECQFNYDYFLPQSVDPSNIPLGYIYSTDRNKRLKLISLQKKNEEKYAFSYNETMLPPKNSYAVDYWGYANGGFNNKTAHLNPNDFNYNVAIPVTEINNNKKIPDINYAKSGILEKIEYPTKGYSKFIYELNEASNLFSQFNKYKYNKGNGLRLAEQKNYDFNNNLIGNTRLEYGAGLTPNPIHMIRQDKAEMFFEIGDCAGKPVVKTIQAQFVAMHSSSINSSFALSSGSGVGYSKVIKKEVDANGNIKGRIETTYSNNEDVHYNISDYTRPVFLPSVKGNKFENGTILNLSVFDKNSVKLKEEKYNYYLQTSPFTYGVTMIHPMFNSYVVNQFSYDQHYKSAIGYYPIYSTETILKDKENTDFISGDSLVTKTDLSYNSYNFINSKSVKFPDGKYNLEKTKYSTEKNNIKLISKNIIGIPLEKEIIGNVINGSSKRTSLTETKYDDSNHLNPTSVISYDQNIANGQNSQMTEVTYNLYDSKGNLLQYVTRSGIPITVIWGYNQTQIIAKIEGGSYSHIMQAFGLDPNSAISYLQLEIVSKSDLDIDTPSENILLSKLDIFRKKAEFKDFNITTYTYDPLVGVKSITSDSGFREFYKYNTQNKLEKIVDSENNILKEYKYNYAPSIFYNSVKSQPFTRNNCGSGAIGGSYTYTVPENKYSSYDSKDAADQQAQNEINANGQNSANTNGTCTPINCYLSMYIGGGGSVSVLNQNYRVQLGFSSGVGRPWTTTGVIIGKINGTCIPQAEKTSSSYSNGFLWSLLVKTNGEIVAKKLEGLGVTGVPDNTSYNLDFTYSIN